MEKQDSPATQLRARGHRITPQRLVILQILKESGQHLTPGQVFARARQVLPGLTEPTVYRTLAFLASQGLALVSHYENGQMAYQYTAHLHHHLVCRICGHILEVEHSTLSSLYDQLLSTTGFKIDSLHITFFGTCPVCQKD